VPSERLARLKPDYQNGEDNIGRDLIEPCLAECTLYKRGTGFFSATALNAYAGSLDRLISGKTKIKIICSPKITSKETIEILSRNSTDSDRRRTVEQLRDEIVLLAIGYSFKVKTLLQGDPEGEHLARREEFHYRCKLLAYFIATNAIELKIAIPRNFSTMEVRDDKLYHVKNGYFVFPDGERVAFEGSVNESADGHGNNIDSTQVFRSWIDSDRERLDRTCKRLDDDWSGNKYIEVMELSPKALEIIRKVSPVDRPRRAEGAQSREVSGQPLTEPVQPTAFDLSPWLWGHQRAAVQEFLLQKRGILEMATGTGKTKTALEIVRQLVLRKNIETLVIATYGTDLLDQWHKELLQWQKSDPSLIQSPLSIQRSYDAHKEITSFCLNPKNSILLVSRATQSLENLVSALQHDNLVKAATLVIHDEIHGLATPDAVTRLQGAHSGIEYVLGLSATPERVYDEVGTKFTKEEIGEVIFKYDLAAAIKDRVLCSFDYHPLEFSYTDEDSANRQQVFKRKAAADKSGQPWSQERTYIELSKVNKKAVMKPIVLKQFLSMHPELISSSIFFVLDKEQGDDICNVIHGFTHNYRTYYAGTDSHFLDALAEGTIDTLVACERLNEGVDIRSLNCVFLVSSDRARLTTIQRIGRCLRKDPNNPDKRASIVDFIPSNSQRENDDDSDFARRDWLIELSKI